MKKLLAIVISMAMIVAMMPMGVFADGTTSPTIEDGVIKVNPENVQDTLDGKYGSIDNKTILLSAGTYNQLELGRATKYADSNTEYRIGSFSATPMNFDSFYKEKNSDNYSGVPYYIRNMSNVTFKAAQDEEVNIEGVLAASGHHYQNDYDYVLDRDVNGNSYFLAFKFENITFEGIKFTAKSDINTSLEETTIDGFTFRNCKFTTKGTEKNDGQAIRYYNENNNGKVKNLTVENCEFENCYQGVYTSHINGVTVTNSNFVTIGHNAIAIQDFKENANHGVVVITNNTFNDIKDRIIRFNNVGADTQITIKNNKATDSGDSAGEVIKATSLAEGITYDICGNAWGEDKSIVNENLKDKEAVAKIDEVQYTDLQAAIAAANNGDTVKLIKDIKEDITVPAGKSITIDLNSKSITNSSSDTITVAQGANLTIKGTGTVDNITHGKAALVNYGTAVLDGGTYTRSLENKENNKNDAGGNSFYTILNDKGGNMTIKDGVTVTNIGHFSSMIRNGGDSTSQSASKLKINGGKFSGGLNTVKNDELGELTVTGGSFSNTSQFVIMNWHKANLSGGSFEANDSAEAVLFTSKYLENRAVGELTVTGGTYICKDNQKVLCDRYDNREEYKGTATITGGIFSSDPSAYVADGYVVTGNGPYTVGRPYIPSTTTDNVTNDTTDKKTTADLTPAVSDNKSTTTVDNTTADKIVDKAVENKSTEVIVDATGNNTVASSEVAIPEKTVKELAEKTDANLVIKTDNGQVDLDKAALAAVAEQAGTAGTVRLVVETVKTDENICHVDLKLITSNGAVKDFKGGNVKVTINLTKELAAKELVCVYIDDNDNYTLVEGVLNADGTYTFTTGHFSEYAVMAKDEADKVIADQLKTMIKDVNLKVRTSKTSKKNIKAVVSGDVKALTDAGYTVKYKFYRSTKKASKYAVLKTKADNTYINTTGKKGTKYYYKAKALVYQGDKLVGQTVLKQCKYGARTWSK